jgi:hypothetical protein
MIEIVCTAFFNVMEPEIAALVKPDYTATATAALFDFSRRHIQQRGDLRLLGWVTGPLDGSPSRSLRWVVDGYQYLCPEKYNTCAGSIGISTVSARTQPRPILSGQAC